MFTRKQTMHFFKAALFLATVIFASCSNNLVQKKNAEFGITITLPQASSTESVGRAVEGATWNIKAQVEDADEKPLQTINRTGASGKTVTLNFDKVGVGKKVRVCVELMQEDQTTPSYTGKSNWFTTKRGTNKITLKLEEVQGEEVITDAATPQITVQPVGEVVTTSETDPFTKELSITAERSDGGTLSFQWQVNGGDDIWENVKNGTSATITVTVNKGESKTYRCVVTNTNNNVNGNKTATATSDAVTVAYVEGTLTSITAKYNGTYEVLGKDFDYRNVTVQETYTSGTGDQTKTTTITVTADSSRYKISPSDSYENAIGYVPYVVTYIAEETPASLTENITVPVKYELSAENLALESYFNGSPVDDTSDGDGTLSVPQYGTVNYVYNSEHGELFLFNDKYTKDLTPIKSLGEPYFAATITSNGNSIENEATCEQSGDFNYNVTLLESKSDWFVCGENNSKNFTVTVCSWKIQIMQTEAPAVATPTPENLSGETNYTLSVTNGAYNTGSVPLTWQSDNDGFTINDTTLTTPPATRTAQTAMITATLNDSNVTLATIKVTVPATLPGTEVSFAGATINDKNGDPVDASIAKVSDTNDITTVTVSNVDNAEDIWAYCATTTEKFNFAANTNYKVYATMFAREETVVGIAAARADMFFTVGTGEQTYEFETGTLQSDLDKQITIGVAAKKTEIYIKAVSIEAVEPSGLPTLSFMISKTGVDEYLSNSSHAENIIELGSTDNGYTIGLNSTGVTLQIRDYATPGKLNKVSFNMTSEIDGLQSNLIARSVNALENENNNGRIIAWNTSSQFSESNTVIFPAFANNDTPAQETVVPCVVDGLFDTGTTQTGSVTISNFEIASIDNLDVTGKVFAIKTGDTWEKVTNLSEYTGTVSSGAAVQLVLTDNLDKNDDDWETLEWDGNNYYCQFLNYASDSLNDLTVSNDNTNKNCTVYKAGETGDINFTITLNEDFTVTIAEATTSGDNTGGGY